MVKDITIGISPCPNDTFIFEAIYNKRIDLGGINYQFIMDDVEALNQMALNGQLDVTKISYNAFTKVVNNYELCHSGSALGRNCGPLLIGKKPLQSLSDIHNDMQVAIPGIHTTANLLLSLAFPQLTLKKEMIFHEIEDAVLNEEVDLGLIIHENRFTYQEKGLFKIRDLGEFWEDTTQQPIPLGGIAINRRLPLELKQRIDRTIKRSVQHAFRNPAESREWIRQNAQEMDPDVIQQHINLYVNEYSIELGNNGQEAVKTLFKAMIEKNLIQSVDTNIFIEHQ